jgi:hypothetical protein
MRYLHLLSALLFVAFAAVQLNDPDPLIWVLIYGAVAAISVLAFFRKHYPGVCVVLALLFVGYSIWFLPGVQEWLGQKNPAQLFDNVAKMEHPFIEESREFLGLWVAAITLLAYGWFGRRQRRAA